MPIAIGMAPKSSRFLFLPALVNLRAIPHGGLFAVAHDGLSQHLGVFQQGVLLLGSRCVLHQGQGVLVPGALVQQRVNAAAGLGHAAQLALADALVQQVDHLGPDAALLEPALGLAGIAALLRSEDLDVHALSSSAFSSAK